MSFSSLKSEIIPQSSSCRAGLHHLLLFSALIKDGVIKGAVVQVCEGKVRVCVRVCACGGEEGGWVSTCAFSSTSDVRLSEFTAESDTTGFPSNVNFRSESR